MNVLKSFNELKNTPSGQAYTALPLINREDVLLGINYENRPCLFVLSVGRSLTPMRSTKIAFLPHEKFDVAIVGQPTRQNMLDMLSCESSDEDDINSFLSLVEAFLITITDAAMIDGNLLAQFFKTMVGLFELPRDRDLTTARQGLWGELFTMSQVRGFQFWAPFWHQEVTRLFDFSSAGRRVEIKTTTSQQRIHNFSHRQIFPSRTDELMVASLMLREDDNGLSLRDLIQDAKNALIQTGHYMKLEIAIRRTGMEHQTEIGPMYDADAAAESLSWFRAENAPHFQLPEPAGVSETRYKVDLSTVQQVSVHDVEEWLDSWPALVG
ncbi:MAG: PD-(D/E)XK motif protein [Dehalococcoidia bacterium]